MSPTDARSTILSKIRAALSDVPASEQPDDVKVPRDYLTTDPDPAESRLERFCERVAEYKATVRQVSAADLPAAIAASCAARGVKSLVVPPDLPSEWIPDGVEIRRDLAPGLSNTQIESSDGVLTAAAWGIAQTGTIVLDSGPGQGRRAPDPPARLSPLRHPRRPGRRHRPRGRRPSRNRRQRSRPPPHLDLRPVRHLRHRAQPRRRRPRAEDAGGPGGGG